MQKSNHSLKNKLKATVDLNFINYLSQPTLIINKNFDILKANEAFKEKFNLVVDKILELVARVLKFIDLQETECKSFNINHPVLGQYKANVVSTSHTDQYLIFLDRQEPYQASPNDDFFYVRKKRLIYPMYKKLMVMEQVTGLAYVEVVGDKENLRYSQNLLALLELEDESKIVSIEDFFNFIYPEDRKIAREIYESCKDGELNEEHEIRLISNNHHVKFIKINCRRLSDKENCTMLVIQDISSQKMLEVALRDNEALFRSIFEQAAVGISQVSPKGELLMFNQKMCDIIGYKPEALSSMHYLNITHPDDVENDLRIVEDIFSNKLDEGIFEKRFLHKSGKTIWAKVHLTVIRDDKNFPKYAVGIVDDISEAKMAEQQIVNQNEELIRLNSEMDNFVYRTSHDLRAPLASVLGLVHLLKKEQNEKNRDEYMQLIKNSVVRLDNSIHEILDLSRNSRTDFEYGLVDLAKIIKSTFNSLAHVKGFDNIKINIEINEEEFFSDEKRIKMIFGNLLSNAVSYQNKYCEKSFIKIDGVIDNKFAKITINDNGVGIDESHLKNIFKMFYRANDHTNGSGLGLYIVKEAVDKLKGKIDVQSIVGNGTTFTLQIPNQKQLFTT